MKPRGGGSELHPPPQRVRGPPTVPRLRSMGPKDRGRIKIPILPLCTRALGCVGFEKAAGVGYYKSTHENRKQDSSRPEGNIACCSEYLSISD